MSRASLWAVAAVILSAAPASAQDGRAASGAIPSAIATREGPAPREMSSPRGSMGGGFIEYLFNGGDAGTIPTARRVGPPVEIRRSQPEPGLVPVRPIAPAAAYAPPEAAPRPQATTTPRGGIDPRFLPQVVSYQTSQRPGTIVIDTRERYLYLVEAGGMARRYGVGIGRPGFGWSGTKTITRKAEWPDWRPPAEMLRRRPDLPRFMAGGPQNPLGARAMYLGSSLYRIHGSNEPHTIGTAVSSGCFRMRNEDVTDLYARVRVGTRVVVN
ncbi:L,D-transpeptidase [Phreatobacter aquaticus]|uniref:L,D-transpeptidase n=1 Tax=Phreatobacter aquaticus TaxID=2570229 RepID=A0A4D7QD72_9HYPH|nr:L,D-transpeptidase [Phreatobacter aquaticus]QCK85158.1 L,D-transpeptidase [Phreatobacter aquaticus]